jgi:hypothetical protein
MQRSSNVRRPTHWLALPLTRVRVRMNRSACRERPRAEFGTFLAAGSRAAFNSRVHFSDGACPCDVVAVEISEVAWGRVIEKLVAPRKAFTRPTEVSHYHANQRPMT